MKISWKIPAAVFSLALACVVSAAEAADKKPFRVGVVIPLSGQVASMGDYVRKGIQLGLSSLPAEQREQVELVFEDDQFDPVKTMSAYQHLSAKGELDAVFVMASPPANALAPVLERKKQILIAIGASDPSIVKDRRYAFIHWVTPPVLGERLARELLKRSYKKIAFVTSEASGTIADRDATIAELKKHGAGDRVVYDQTVAKDQTDFRTEIAAIRSKQADAVMLVLFAGSLSSFAKQAKQLQLEAEISGMETFEDESEVKASEGALIGTWYVNAADPSDEFIAKYKAAYSEHPGWAAANGYDTIRLLAEGVDKTNGNREAVRDFLTTVKDYQGAAGKYSSSGDNRFNLPAALKRVTAQGFEKFE